jgi:leucine dehydrogenase|tara:strand:- start:4453 stop:5502 length:1050 start_codon:yes stop_codon:yes gene_type:complete
MQMSVFESPSFDAHELVHFASDAATGLQTIIAVHSTALGCACGGCRLWPYSSSDEALEDALRLSRGMSYKNALAGIPLGGGKAVIMADADMKSAALMRAFGRVVEQLGGRYITAEDVGVSVKDMQYVAEETQYVRGLPHRNSAGGDPSPYTAQGVFLGMKAALVHRYGMADFHGIRVLVQGVGHVGFNLCKILHAAGAELIVADISAANLRRVQASLPVTVVGVEDLIAEEADIYAPCALGAVLNDDTIPILKADIVAGAANNQLAGLQHGEALRQRGILYAPDYVVNSGGIINVWSEMKSLPKESVCDKISRIYDITLRILREADEQGTSSNLVADEMALALIQGKAA